MTARFDSCIFTRVLPGGYYIGPDGRAHDAHGRPLAPVDFTDAASVRAAQVERIATKCEALVQLLRAVPA